MKRHAVALRAFTHGDESFAKDQVILNMDRGHFADWSADGVDLVRAATDAEVATARGHTAPAPTKQPRSARRRAKPAKAKFIPPAGQNTPADAGSRTGEMR